MYDKLISLYEPGIPAAQQTNCIEEFFENPEIAKAAGVEDTGPDADKAIMSWHLDNGEMPADIKAMVQTWYDEGLE